MLFSIAQPEWRELLEGKIAPRLSSLSLQLKLNALKNNIKANKISLTDAITELYKYCTSNPKMYEADLKKIFKQL